MTVNQLPSATATASPASITTGSSSTLTATGGGTYAWSTGGTSASISVSPTATTTYTVTVTGTNGCTKTATVTVTVTAPVCSNITNAGTIGTSTSGCTTTGSFDPPLITSITDPSGGTGTIEYIWLQTTDAATAAGTASNWTTIAGATSSTYDPSPITVICTQFVSPTYAVQFERREQRRYHVVTVIGLGS